MANKEFCKESKKSLDENIVSQKSTTKQQDSTTHFNELNNHDIIKHEKTIENNVSIKHRCSKNSFKEVTG